MTKQTNKQELEPRTVELVRSTYQPSKAELEEPIEFPEGTTVDDLVKAVMRPVDVRYVQRPKKR